MNNSKTQPQIRFPEFKYDWTYLQLNKLLAESKKRNFDNKYTREDVLSVSGEFGIVNQVQHLGRSYAGASIANYHVVEKGDVVYTKSPLKANPYGIIKANKGKDGIVSTLYAVYTPKENTSELFLDYYFQLDDRLNKYLRPLVHKGAKNDMKINNQHVLSGYICVPEFYEQLKISEFLNLIDKKIIYLRKKNELLKKYKLTIAQQLMNQTIRFKKASGEDYPNWEIKKLREIMTESKIKGSKGDEAKKITVKLWGKGVLGKIDKIAGSANTQYYVRTSGQFIYSKLDFLNCAFGIIPPELDGYESTIDLPAFDVNKDYDARFILERVKLKNFYKKHGETADGSRKARRIHADVFLNFSIQVPEYEEQHRIANFLSILDNKINTSELLLNLVRKYKKSLLQNMFI